MNPEEIIHAFENGERELEPLLEKMGIDHKKAWTEFEVQAERIKAGEIEYISWEDADA